jgi:hypothetical protein
MHSVGFFARVGCTRAISPGGALSRPGTISSLALKLVATAITKVVGMRETSTRSIMFLENRVQSDSDR